MASLGRRVWQTVSDLETIRSLATLVGGAASAYRLDNIMAAEDLIQRILLVIIVFGSAGLAIQGLIGLGIWLYQIQPRNKFHALHADIVKVQGYLVAAEYESERRKLPDNILAPMGYMLDIEGLKIRLAKLKVPELAKFPSSRKPAMLWLSHLATWAKDRDLAAARKCDPASVD